MVGCADATASESIFISRQQIARRRLRFTDNQRRRLAAKAKQLGRKVLAQIATPETLLGWHRKLIANKYDGSAFRTVGRPRKSTEIFESRRADAPRSPWQRACVERLMVRFVANAWTM